jgi:hypothetical protein
MRASQRLPAFLTKMSAGASYGMAPISKSYNAPGERQPQTSIFRDWTSKIQTAKSEFSQSGSMCVNFGLYVLCSLLKISEEIEEGVSRTGTVREPLNMRF